MNLHTLVSGAIGVVNPHEWITYRACTGYTTAADGTRTPTYAAPRRRLAQVQNTTTNDLRKVDALHIQGQTLRAWMAGEAEGVERQSGRGGDLFTRADGSVWLVQSIIEQWPGWVALLLVRQMDRP